MKHKNSIPQRIMRVLESHSIDGMKLAEVADALKVDNTKIYAPMWKLKTTGKVSLKDHYYRLTTVNKPDAQELPITMQEEPQDEPADNSVATHKRLIVKLRKEIESLNEANKKLGADWRNARESSLHYERLYLDTLAVVKYLESK